MFEVNSNNKKAVDYITKNYEEYYYSAIRKLASDDVFDESGILREEYALNEMEIKAISFVSSIVLDEDIESYKNNCKVI